MTTNDNCLTEAISIDKVIETVEQTILSRSLNPLERLIFHQSWYGRDYSEMTQDGGYGSNYLKQVGSQLWRELSEILGQRVTKKNIHIVLSRYQQNQASKQLINTQLETEEVDTFSGLNVQPEINFASKPLAVDSHLYINRPPIEELTCKEIDKPGCVIRIKAPRKMGKSSLLNQILAHAQTHGYKTVCVDFLEADNSVFESLNKFLRWFCANITKELQLESKLEDYWDEDMGSKVSCKVYFQGHLLEQINSPLVLALNEVNRVFEYPHIAQDFLSMLRFWHEQAQIVKIWQKLRLVVVHSTEVYLQLKLNQSPFNVGIAINLPQFSLKQGQDLAERYGLNCKDSNEIKQLIDMVGGHPYLLNIAFEHLYRKQITLPELLQAAPTPTGIYSNYLRDVLAILRNETELLLAMQQVVNTNESVPLEAIAAYKLESMGLIQLDGNLAKPSCELYRLYFCQQLRNNS